MKICVEFGEGAETSVEIESELRRLWPSDVMIVNSEDDDLPRGTEGLLILGEKSNHPTDSLIIVERVSIDGRNVDQVIFEASGLIGRMLASDSLKNKVSLRRNNKETSISRRALFSGVRTGGIFQSYSGFPLITHEICDARYGCSKCIQTCPTEALTIVDGSLVLKEDICSEAGLCASVCPVSAIQMPRFSDAQFYGLINGLVRARPDLPKTLIFTCNKRSVTPRPFTFVQEVKDIGIIGPRQLAIAAATGIDAIIVHCADGNCQGKKGAQGAVEAIRAFIREDYSSRSHTLVRYFEGEITDEQIPPIISAKHAKLTPNFVRESNEWTNYIHALEHLKSNGVILPGLRLTNLRISDTCTLCEVCTKYCPHGALKVSQVRWTMTLQNARDAVTAL